MKQALYTVLVALVVVTVGSYGVDAAYYTTGFSLQNNSQCSGGTLIAQYSDVADTGAAVAAKELAVQDCQMLMTGPGQCCSVQYRRSTPAPPAIGSHVWSYQIYSGATVVQSTPPPGTSTNTFQHWAGIAGGSGQCSGTWQLDYTDLSDLSCPVNLSQTNIYKNVPDCPTNLGQCTGGICKINSIAESGASCVVQTEIYNCVGSNGAVVSGSCTAPAPVTASLVANPGSIVRGEQSLLTWSSQNAQSCTGTGFNTNSATQGSVAVSPTQTTNYKVSCVSTSGEASATATVTVTQPNTAPDFTVSCRAHPTQAGIGEDVLWSSTVTGGEGTYAYVWSGSEGLSGNGNQVFKQYSNVGLKTASLTVKYTPNGPVYAVPAPGGGDPQPEPEPQPEPPAVSGPLEQIPIGSACPALGFVTPITPCSGVWAPTYDTGGCQSGWQCIPLSGGGGGSIAPSNTIEREFSEFQFLNFNEGVRQLAAIVPGILELITGGATTPAASGNIVPHTEGELFTSQPTVKQDMLQNGGVNFSETTFVGRTFSADQTTMNRVCAVLHGAGSTATNIGARGYSSCGNNQNFQFSAGTWKVVSGCSGAHLSGSFSCVVPVPAPTPGSCTLTVSPSTVQVGQSAVLSWTSSDLSSLSINNGVGSVTPVSGGSVTVTPSAPGTYSYSGSGNSSNSSTNYTVQSALSGFVAAMSTDTAKYGITYSTSYGTHADQVTLDHVCSLVFGAGSDAVDWDVTAFDSCGNNSMLTWTGSAWTRTGACTSNQKILRKLDCSVPSTQTAPPVQCNNAGATLTVVQPAPSPETQTVTVQCENGVTIHAPQCSDGIDNDGDGVSDYPDDPNCTEPEDDDEDFDDEVYLPQCSDGIDNDGDGKIDYSNKIPGVANDPGCISPDDEDERDTPTPTPQCSDGVDNDGDGLVDAEDPGCTSGGGGGGGGGYDPSDNSEGGSSGGAAQCSDGIDNNGDGNVDFPDDPGCSSSGDNSEGGTAGELSLQATPPLIKKGQQCTLQLSARNVTSCSLTGPSVSRGFTAQNGIVSATTVVTPELSQTSTYTLTCNGTDGKTTTKTVDCKIAPTFEEF